MTEPKRRRSRAESPPTPDPETYQIGTWHGRPNYGCPFCPFATLNGTAEVVAHVAGRHRNEATDTPEEAP